MNTGGQQGGNAAGGQEDYLDKGVFPPLFFSSLFTITPPSHPPTLSTLQSSPRPAPNKTNHLAGLDAAEKKFGQGKVDPNKERGVNEKVTDKARGMFEKATGYVLLFVSLFFVLLMGGLKRKGAIDELCNAMLTSRVCVCCGQETCTGQGLQLELFFSRNPLVAVRFTGTVRCGGGINRSTG